MKRHIITIPLDNKPLKETTKQTLLLSGGKKKKNYYLKNQPIDNNSLIKFQMNGKIIREILFSDNLQYILNNSNVQPFTLALPTNW